ncbi:MAG: FkbM family methyltransferase [Bradyrhizobium sp.]|nr:FkbM family methyltransferase [Bradyrhizobium sp.]
MDYAGQWTSDDRTDHQVASLAEISRFYVRALKARFRDHRPEFDAIKRHIRAGDIVCDVGANKGSFTYWLSRWCGENGRLIAFEPQPRLAHRLAVVCADIGLRNVTVEAKAVHSSSGLGELYIPSGQRPGASLNRSPRSTGKFDTLPVPVISLDEYFKENERISLLKIDVEGAELEVFWGARRILEECSPALIFECEARHLIGKSVSDVFAYLESLGYRGRFFCDGEARPLSTFSVASHQRQEGKWFWKQKNYCNNFIFSKDV